MTRARLSRDLYLGFAIAFIGIRLVSLSPWDQSVDAYAYWSTRAGPLYNGSSVGAVGSYLYSPAFALLIAPIGWLSWPVFNALWTTMNVAILWKLAGRWSFVALVFVPIPLEIIAGNVHLLFAAVAVYGIRYPALWAIPLITKVTPGIGLVWFAVRGEWRSLAVAMGVTGVLVVVSYLLSPQAWSTWIDLLLRSDSAPTSTPGFYLPIALPIRLAVATVLVVYAAHTNRPWLLPLAMTLSLPLIWLNGLAVLAGLAPEIIARYNARAAARAERNGAAGSVVPA